MYYLLNVLKRVKYAKWFISRYLFCYSNILSSKLSLITHEIGWNQFSWVHSLSMSTKINNIFYSKLHHQIVSNRFFSWYINSTLSWWYNIDYFMFSKEDFISTKKNVYWLLLLLFFFSKEKKKIFILSKSGWYTP